MRAFLGVGRFNEAGPLALEAIELTPYVQRMFHFMKSSKSYVAKIGDLPEISFEADGDAGFARLLRDTINGLQGLLDLDGRTVINFTRPNKTTGRITAGAARHRT
jgi:hypothetical protein